MTANIVNIDDIRTLASSLSSRVSSPGCTPARLDSSGSTPRTDGRNTGTAH